MNFALRQPIFTLSQKIKKLNHQYLFSILNSAWVASFASNMSNMIMLTNWDYTLKANILPLNYWCGWISVKTKTFYQVEVHHTCSNAGAHYRPCHIYSIYNSYNTSRLTRCHFQVLLVHVFYHISEF